MLMKINDKVKIKASGKVQLHNSKGELLAETTNIMVTTGLNLLAAGLTGEVCIGWGELGTSDTAPAITDTQLGAEYVRNGVGLASALANVATIQTFFPGSTCKTNIKEAGLAGSDGSSSANTGTLGFHALISYDNSVNGYDLVLTWAITLAIGS